MKRIMIPAILVAGTTLACQAATPDDQQAADVEQEIIALERADLDHWSAGDAVGYAQNAANDVTYFDDIGASTLILGREDLEGYLTSLEIPSHDYEVVDPRVQVYDDVAILTLHYHGLTPDGEVGSRWKATIVYHRDGDAWKKVHANWSIVRG